MVKTQNIIIMETFIVLLSIRWFEANVPGSVPNEFSIPFFGLAKKCWRRCKTSERPSINTDTDTEVKVEVEESR